MRALIALLALAPLASLAASVTVTWTHPTAFTDGTVLSAAQIASTRVEYGSCSGTAFGTKAGETTVPAPATTTTVTLAPGTHCVRAFTRTTAAAGNLESSASGVATVTVPFSPPNPPTLVTVNVVARIAIPTRDGVRVALDVGRVPLGTACGEVVKDDYATIPRDAVKLNWLGRLAGRNAQFVAECG